MMEADSVYVYVNSTYRTSRNIRAEWYFRHLNRRFELQSLADLNVAVAGDHQPALDGSSPAAGDLSSPLMSPTSVSSTAVKPSDASNDPPDSEFVIVAASVNGVAVTRPPEQEPIPDSVPEHETPPPEQPPEKKTEPSDEEQPAEFFLGPSTQVLFLMHHYRLVFVIDMSASMFSLTDDGDMRLHKALEVLEESLMMLSRVVRLSVTDFVFSPTIKVAVIAHSELETRVLLQGWTLHLEGISRVMADVRLGIDEFEHELQTRAAHRSLRSRIDAASAHSSPRLRLLEAPTGACSPPYATAGLQPGLGGPAITSGDLLSMIRHAMIAVSFLSSDYSTPGFIVITDENLCMGDAQLLDRTLQMLRSDGISCSFIKVGSVMKENLREPSFTNFGQVDYRELCQFISKATIGSHFNINQRWSLDSDVLSPSSDLNVVQKAFLGWSFQKGLSSVDLQEFNWSEPRKKNYIESVVKAPIFTVLSLRLREGYILKEFKFTRPSSKLTINVELVLPWKPGVLIHYNMTSLWPPDQSQETRVQAVVWANYDFLHEATCNKKRQEPSEYVARLLERFRYHFVSLKRADLFLEHLHRFTNTSAYHTVPQQYRNGLMSVFEYMPGTNQSRPTERVISDQAAGSFVEYWTLMKEVDMNTSHRWMHTECMDLILEHDFPLPRHLSMPASNGKFTNIQCRQAVQLVNQSLRNWASFTLIENHSYVKFIYSSEKSTVPSSFFIIRLGQHTVSAVSLKFAFLAAITGAEREKQIAELIEILRSKMFPRRGRNADPKARHRSNAVATFRTTFKGKKAHIPPLQRDLSETPCCTFITRHLDRVIVSFDPKLLHPRSFHLRMDLPMHRNGGNSAPTGLASGGDKLASKLRLLSDHLLHQRHVWVTSHVPFYSASSVCLSHIFYSLTVLRLQEGFHFLQSKDGFLSMYQDLRMREAGSGETVSCSVQYILYLHRVARRSRNQESVSSDQSISLTEKAFSTPEDDSPVLRGDQVVTEVWIEPQVGRLVSPMPEFAEWEGKTVEEMPSVIFSEDRECLQIYLTLQQLRDKFLVFDMKQPSDPSPPHGSYNGFVKMEYLEPNLSAVLSKSPSLTLQLALYRFSENRKNTDACLNVFISHLCDQMRGPNRFSEIFMSDAEARNFTYEVVFPLLQNDKLQQPEEIFKKVEHSCWRCFVKSCDENSDHLSVLVIPSSTEALSSLGLATTSEEEWNYLPLFLFVTSRLYIGYLIEDRWTYERPQHREIRINDDNDSLTKELEKEIRESFEKASRKTEKLTNEMEKLSEHIIDDAKLLIHLHSTTYLESVYLCLQKRFIIHQKDLEYAFHNLCDDLPPLEINITRYLRSVCGHCWPYDRERLPQQRGRKLDEDGDCVVSAVGPRLSDLHSGGKVSCERRQGLHDRIRRRVRLLVMKYFTRIPNCPHYFVYRPSKEATEEEEEEEEAEEREREILEKPAETEDKTKTAEKENDGAENKAENDKDETEDSVLLGGMERRLSYMDATNEEDDLDGTASNKSKPKLFPFFFHIGCTVTYKGSVDNVDVDHIPTCLGEFKDILVRKINDQSSVDDLDGNSSGDNEVNLVNRNAVSDNEDVYVDLQAVKITLDLYPLTMRDDTDPEDTEGVEKDHFAPVSNDSDVDADNVSTDDGLKDSPSNSIILKQQRIMPVSDALNSAGSDDDDGDDGQATSAYSCSHSGVKSCNILPPLQRRTFDTCKEELEWILEDEIICCMKYEARLTERHLQSIVDHINCIMDRKERFVSAASVLQCISRLSKRLRFVLSWEEGCKNFFEQFAKAAVGENYRVVEIGSHYCVCSLVPDSFLLPSWQAKDIPSWQSNPFAGDGDPPQIIDRLPGHSVDKLWRPSAIKLSSRQRHRRTSHSVPFDRPVAQHGSLYRSVSLSELSSSNLMSDSRKTSLTVDPSAGGKGGSGSEPATRSVDVTRARSAGPSNKISHVPSSGQLSQRDQSTSANPFSGLTSPINSENVGNAYGIRSTPGHQQPHGTTIASSSVGMFLSRGASSRGSLAEGYDGDFSSIGGPDDMNWGLDNDYSATPDLVAGRPNVGPAGPLVGDARTSPTVTIPAFWLIARLKTKHLEVFFHHTDSHVDPTDLESGPGVCHYCGVRERLMQEIDMLNRLVNQKMLLNDLLDTRRCNSLLVAPSQEEVQWLGDEARGMHNASIDVYDPVDDEDNEAEDKAWWYKNKMEPGHFMCPLLWRELFPIDKRIQMTLSGRPGRVLSNLRTALEHFAVSNRKDMYVMTFNGTLYIILSELYVDRGNGGGMSALSTVDLSTSMDLRSTQMPEDAMSVSSLATTTDQSHAHHSDAGSGGTINTLEMCVYGITNPDTDVRQNLNSLMQSKLDNLLLGFLCSCLMRNNNLRLHDFDIRFIQPPACLPNLCLNLQLPQLVQPFLVPFCFYLKQHLGHFLISPRYHSNRPTDRFIIPTGPVVDVKTSTVAEPEATGVGEAYVYNTYYGESIPTYGLACVVVQLVCGWLADPVEVISCPAPTVLAGELLMAREDLRSLVQVFELSDPRTLPRRSGPGPANYLRFFVWKRGDVDVEMLRQKLESAVTAACEDVLMEYRLLTMPVADLGGRLRDVYASNSDEAAALPPRSATISGGSGGSAPVASPIKRRQSLADMFRLWTNSKASTEENNPSPRSSLIEGCQNTETVQFYMDLEAGEAGELHAIYPEVMLSWMEQVGRDNLVDKNLSWHLFFKRTFQLQSTVSIASFLETGVRFFHPTISRGSLFQLTVRPDGSEAWELRKVHSEDRPLTCGPGSRPRFLLIGRNYQHWSKHMASRGLLEVSRPTTISNEVWHHVRAHLRLSGSEDSKEDGGKEGRAGGLEGRLPAFCKVRVDGEAVIPRQLFCLLHVNGTQVSFFSYNFSKDTNAKIADQLSSLVEWHNARFGLLSCLMRQKVGSFQGLDETCSSFNASEKAKQLTMMGTPPSSHFGSKPGLPSHAGAVGRSLVGPRGLGASGAPVMAANAAAATAGAAEGKSVPAYRSFVQTMHTTRYTGDLPMPLRGGAFASDLIQRHGQQVLLARKLEMEMDREKSDLEELARRWYLKVASGSRVPDDRLKRMKSFCRLLHTVTVPLLLHPALDALTSPNRSPPLAQQVARRKHSLGSEKKR